MKEKLLIIVCENLKKIMNYIRLDNLSFLVVF